MKSVLFNYRVFGYCAPALLLTLGWGCVISGGSGTSDGGGGTVNRPPPGTFDPGPPITNPNNTVETSTIDSLPVSKNCEHCHTSIFADWADSAHARAIISPATVAENNALFAAELKDQPGPDPKQFCVNCHSPIVTATALTNTKSQDATLPFKDANLDASARSEGIGCTTCHSYTGSPQRSVGGLAFFQNDFDLSGQTFYGPFDNAVQNSAHQARSLPTFRKDSAQQLCINCHNVFYDLNNDRKFDQPVVGEDLILQNTSAEFDQYVANGNTDKTCIDCHMPVKQGVTRVADGAKVGTDEQKSQAPSRVVRSHKFVGVDYPLDDTPDLSLSDRVTMLQQGVTMDTPVLQFNKNNGKLDFDVVLTNNQTGHNFPTGFAFARQLFIEVVITDQNGKFLDGSGRLLSATDDLCDNTTFNSPFGTLLSNCPQVDKQLVNLQLELVSVVEKGVDPTGKNGVVIDDDAGGKETVIQDLHGGAVIRVRPSDNKALNPLAPNEKRAYHYSFVVQGQGNRLHVSTKLRFRNLPPYFIRALRDLSPPQAADLTKALGKLKIIDITQVVQDVQ